MKFLYLCLLCTSLFGDGTLETFAKFPNKVFVETGTSYGNGLELAMRAGFSSLYSIEIREDLFRHCKERFADRPEVILFHGDSADLLFNIIQDIDQPITFWLDGHTDSPSLGHKYSPILEELEIIKKHPIKTHTILIDDVRLFGSQLFSFVSKNEIIQKILEINPEYQISYEKGYVSNDILVAKVQ